MEIISAGSVPADAEVLGLLDEDRNKIFLEAIEAIIAVWTGERPYDFDRPHNRFKISTARAGIAEFDLGVIPKPFQRPYPEIVGTIVSPHSKTAAFMGENGFHPLSANFLLPQWVKTHWARYAEGVRARGAEADPRDWRVARTIFVADDDRLARRYAIEDEQSPYRFYYRQIIKKFRAARRLFVFKDHPDQPDDTITDDAVLNRLVIHGGVDKVVDEILALHDEIGPFGELVYGGVFRLRNIPEAQMAPLLMVEAPRLLFPFARQVLASVTQQGGFPPLMMEPVDFQAIYLQNLKSLQDAQAAPTNGGGAPTPTVTN